MTARGLKLRRELNRALKGAVTSIGAKAARVIAAVKSALAIGVASSLAVGNALALIAALCADRGLKVRGCGIICGECGIDDSVEDVVDLLTDVNLTLIFNVILIGVRVLIVALCDLVGHVKLRACSIVVLNGRSKLNAAVVTSMVLVVVLVMGVLMGTIANGHSHVIAFLGSKELAKSLTSEINIAILAGTSARFIDRKVVANAKDVVKGGVYASRLDFVHPAIGPARGNVCPQGGVIEARVGTGFDGRRGGDVYVLRNVLPVEHRPGVASLDKDDELVKHLLG